MRALIVGALIALGGGAHADTIAWHASLSAAMATSRVSGKPVLALFVGEGCGPCIEMQTITMTDPQVVAAVAGFETAVINTLTERVLATHFLVATVPTVKFLHPTGPSFSITLGRIAGTVLASWRAVKHMRIAARATPPPKWGGYPGGGRPSP